MRNYRREQLVSTGSNSTALLSGALQQSHSSGGPTWTLAVTCCILPQHEGKEGAIPPVRPKYPSPIPWVCSIVNPSVTGPPVPIRVISGRNPRGSILICRNALVLVYSQGDAKPLDPNSSKNKIMARQQA